MTGMGTTVRRTHLAAFLLGGVMGVMAEMAAGLILYEGAGLLRATTVVLTTEAAAAGAGLLFATRVPAGEISRHLRRHLHLTLVSLGLAGILTSVWEYHGGLSEVWNGGGYQARIGHRRYPNHHPTLQAAGQLHVDRVPVRFQSQFRK